MRYALTRPEIVRALILIDTQAGVEDRRSWTVIPTMHDWTTNGR
jgi:pimeloyl-ACP methyl ester carboxylesterase